MTRHTKRSCGDERTRDLTEQTGTPTYHRPAGQKDKPSHETRACKVGRRWPTTNDDYTRPMALDICVESYGMMVQALDTGLMNHLSTWTARAERRYRSEPAIVEGLHEVKEHADGLGFAEARALWLVDVCGCNYAEAATEMRISRDELAAFVAGGRTRIRAGLTD